MDPGAEGKMQSALEYKPAGAATATTSSLHLAPNNTPSTNRTNLALVSTLRSRMFSGKLPRHTRPHLTLPHIPCMGLRARRTSFEWMVAMTVFRLC